jgi:YHS domain-containing protein
MKQANADLKLDHLRAELEARLRAHRREPIWSGNDFKTEMQAFEGRKARFDLVAPQLIVTVILPWLSEVASHFSTSRVEKSENGLGGCLWLGYSERFPVTAKAEVRLSHDAGFQNVAVRFEASIAPSFQHFEPNDKLLLALGDSNFQQLANWLDDRLLEFVDAYMRTDRGCDDFGDEPVTDAVCGMRLLRSKCHSSIDLHGHSYFFCTETCRKEFEQQPSRFVSSYQSM